MNLLNTWLVDKVMWAATEQLPGSGVGHSAGAGSPFSTYDAGIAIYVFLAATLVTTLLIGAFLILNYGMMSKRPEDRIGTRTPSEPGFFKDQLWPKVPYIRNQLPAEEEDEERRIQEEERKKAA